MDPERTPEDQLSTSLQWPATSNDPSDKDLVVHPETDPQSHKGDAVESTADNRVHPEIEPHLLPIRPAAGVDPHLGSIAIRLDALYNATSLLRTVISERLADYSNEVVRTQSLSSRDREDTRKVHDRNLAQIDARLSEQEESLRRLEQSSSAIQARLAGAADGFSERFGDLEGHLHDLDQAVQKINTQLSNRLDQLADTDARLGNLQVAVEESVLRADQIDQSLEVSLGSIQALLDRQFSNIDRRLEEQSSISNRLETMFERFQSAQADDLERVVDAIEAVQITGEEAASPISTQLEEMAKAIGALRRRISLRARPDQPLDEKAVEQLARSIVQLISPALQAAVTISPQDGRWPPRKG